MCIVIRISKLTTKYDRLAKNVMVKIKILILESSKLTRYISISRIA